MIRQIKKLISHPLISGSGLIMIGSFAANIVNYFFNLYMGRTLRVEEYGLLTALVSVWVIFAVLQLSISGILAKFTAKYSAKQKSGFLSFFITNSLKIVVIFSIVVTVFLFVFIQPFSELLKVTDLRITSILILMISVSIIQSVPLGILQGKLSFLSISLFNITGPLLKFILSFAALYLGFGVFGVIVGIFLSALMPFVFVMGFVIKKFANEKKKEIKIVSFVSEIKDYSIKFFLATLGISIISHADIIMVRYFLTETISGQYAALSLMGKAIFYLTGPISFVLYPLIAQKKERKESSYDTMLLAGLIVIASSTALSFAYFMVPNLVLSVFFPSPDYKILAKYLGPYSLFIILFSVVNLLNNYFFSSGKVGVYKINILAGLLFLGLFSIFHNSLYQVIGVLFTTTMIMLVFYIGYYKYHGRG